MEKLLMVKKLSSSAQLPARADEGAAGYDIASATDVVVPGRSQALIPTGLAITVPPGTYGRIAPRSGLAVRHGITVGAGVVDRSYTGHVQVLLMNTLEADFPIRQGDRVAQLILEKITVCDVAEVSELPCSKRGTAGFGSTGVSTF